MRRLISAAGAVVAIASAVVVSAPAAQAAAAKCAPAVAGGKACFYSNGDVMKVTDTEADGFHVRAIWRTSYGRHGECRASGAGKTTTCNYNMREGQTITFYIQIWDGNKEPVRTGHQTRVKI